MNIHHLPETASAGQAGGSSVFAGRIENLAIARPRTGFAALSLSTRLLISITTILFIVWSLMIYLTYVDRRNGAITEAQVFADSVNQMTVATITAMMLTGVANERGVFLDQVRNSNGVTGIRVFRYGSLYTQYGQGAPDSAPTAEENAVLKTGKPFFKMSDDEKSLAAIFPMPNAKNYLGKDCTSCHIGQADEIIGGVSMHVNLKEAREDLQKFTWRISLIALALSLPLLGAIYWLIRRDVAKPLGGEPATVTELANRIAAGDLSMQIEVKPGDTGSVMAGMKTMQASVQALVSDAAMLSAAAVAGKLATRADAMKHRGEFSRVIDGVNQTLDAVIGPLNVAASYVDQISKGAIPAKITDSYNGDFNAIKNNLNVCIDAVNALVADARLLSRAAVEGKLETRADEARHQGDFRKVVEGVNATLDAVIGPLNQGMRVFEALSRGDLTEKITDNYQGDFGKLKEDANLTVEKLAEIVTQIKESTESINVASREIASGNADLSHRTEVQASSLEQTASSMVELTGTVKQNAESARQANQLAAGASEVAVKGGQVVGQVVTTMSSINASSKKIVDIISVIDGIAFQTNILALNAAVEAARAGEQGRGFAVVATEVRMLAQKSAAAAKEIKALIGDSVDKVGAGTRLVDEAGTTMNEIVNAVKRVTDIMAEITAASQEQSTGIEQVNNSIAKMDEVTQQNAALVEQAAAAAESMEEQAGNLARAVAMFRLTQQTGLPPVTERRAPDRAKNVTRLPGSIPQACS